MSIGGVDDSSKIEPLGEKPSGPQSADVKELKIRTLSDLKGALVDKLGEEEGNKMYNDWMKSMGMMMITDMQKSAQRAVDAQKQARREG